MTTDPNEDLIGYVIVTERGGFVVMGTAPGQNSYVNCDELNPRGTKIGETVRSAELLRSRRALEA